MWTLGVVDDRERVAEALEFRDCFGLGLLFEPPFQGLLEPFDFAAGGGMVRSTVFLFDAEAMEFGFEGVASATPAGEPGRIDHSVISQC